MKKLGEMTNDEIIAIINKSKFLRDALDDYIQDCEMDYLTDKLGYIKKSLSDWSIGFYSPSYIKVKDYDLFIDGVFEHKDCFGLSEKCEKLANRCKKMRRTNLFEYYAEQLKDLFFEDEFQSIINWVEDCGYELYCGEVGEKSADYVECWSYSYEDYLYDEEEDVIYTPHKMEVA